ncbi:MAG TPA: CHAD domain-containing protein [Anaerolineaceae bacterium]|nr:CHAD domain-containing protein [Anaerolineaceae bacterium]
MMNAAADAITVYGAKIISRHAAAMAAEMDGVRKAEDIEYIHRMRVATRRMRSALSIFKRCFPKKEFQDIDRDVRKVTRALGEARDLDVQLDVLREAEAQFNTPRLLPGLKRLELRLTQKRAEAQQHVISAMDRLLVDRLLERLQAWYAPLLDAAAGVYLYAPALYQLAFESVQARVKELLGHVPYISDPANVLELHAMRISAKRLRYTLEAFDDLYDGRLKPYLSTVRKMQDQLGLIHDLDVWIMYVPTFIEEERARIVGYFGTDHPLKRLLPGLTAFQNSRQVMRESAYIEFLGSWSEIEAAKTWEEMMRLLNTPMDLESALRLLESVRSANNPNGEIDNPTVAT